MNLEMCNFTERSSKSDRTENIDRDRQGSGIE